MINLRRFLMGSLVFILFLTITGCGINSGGGSPSLTPTTYGGADPKGDYIAISINGTAVTYHNYTTGSDLGPYNFTKVTDPSQNGGFQNIYQTSDIGGGQYVRFVIMDGVALIYQLFNPDGSTAGNPVYAFNRKQVNIDSYQQQSFNWMQFQMDATPENSNFSAGFAFFDDATAIPVGKMYGAGYSSRDEIEGRGTNGITSIGSTFPGVGTGSFTYNSSIVSNTCDTGNVDPAQPRYLTMVATQSNDFVLDFGLNHGAGYAIRQASTSSFQSVYNGTYLIFVYENDNAGSATQTIKMMKVVFSGSGHCTVYPFNNNTPSDSFDFEPLATTSHGPGNNPVAGVFQTVSGCTAASSSVKNTAYQCFGGFLSQTQHSSTTSVNVAFFDPLGRYLCFDGFDNDGGGSYRYRFGFGIKDPNN